MTPPRLPHLQQILAGFAALALMATAAFAEPPASPEGFAFCAGIDSAVTRDALYQVPLSDRVIAASRPGFEDIRLFDHAGKEVPYTIIGNIPPHEATESYQFEITGYDRRDASVTVLLRLPEKRRPVSVIDLDIADRDFRKRVLLSHSSDGNAWSSPAEYAVFDFSSQVDLRRTRLEFGATEDRYFRMTFSDPEPAAGPQQDIRLTYNGLDFSVNGARRKELRIRSFRASTTLPAEKRPVYDQLVVSPVTAATDKDGNTVIILSPSLPVHKVTFSVASQYYSRTVQLFGSDTGKDDSYRLLATQMIYRFPFTPEQQAERNTIEPGLPKQTWLKIVIVNRNDPPLDLQSLTLSRLQQNLYFFARNDESRHSLCYGNSKVSRPAYDIVQFVNQDTLSRYAYARLTPGAEQEGKALPLTLSERISGMERPILKIVVSLLMLGLGYWLYSLLSKTGRT